MRNRTATPTIVNENAAPEEWPSGSAIYKEGAAHREKPEDLLGHTVRQADGSYKAWAHKMGKHLFLGKFASHFRALQVVCGR